MKDKNFPTPSEFYRRRRPEYFSDSKTIAKVILPREQLDFEISQIAVNQKHDNFETLCRKLAERLISPNLIPQVGPTGGGDGKTDFETYPVSNFIFDRWFISENKWNENENWAFAISAKTDWKSKVKSDVKKIVETNRDYTKIFFFSNQKISSRNKKEIQDQIKIDFKIELVILDSEWILEKVYSNNLINDIIESLNLSRVYLEERIVGAEDLKRLSILKEFEDKINFPDRFFEIDPQLVEDCLESAIISRQLELTKAEVIGKFERAIKFANKLGNNQLKIRVHYQFAWTLINWYDDYKEFYTHYLFVKELAKLEPNLNSIELYSNLFNLIRTISKIEEAQKLLLLDFENEEQEFILFITKCSQNETKPSSSLLAKFYLSFVNIIKNNEDERLITVELINLKKYFEISKHHLDIPFDSLKEVIEIFGEILPNNMEYDNLIDLIADIEAVRISDLSSGQTYLKRGITKLEHNYNRESLIYFGKAARKLAKEETQTEFYYCLMLLSDAYSKLDLYWASYNALVSASNIFANTWYTTGKLNSKFIKSVGAILENEAFIGRVPVLICWYELYMLLKNFFQQSDVPDNSKEIPQDFMTDACLATRLVNLPFEKFEKLTYLPDILHKNDLWLSGDAVFYLLGNEDLIEIDETRTGLRKDSFPQFYNTVSNQPFVEQIAYETNLLDENDISISSRILGVQVVIKTNASAKLLILSETILAYLESFLATSFEQAIPLTEIIILNIKFEKIDTFFTFNVEENNEFALSINESYQFKGNDIAGLMDEILPVLISKNYFFKDLKLFFENLYKKDEVYERLSIILEHNNFLTNILTTKPKLFLLDWKTETVNDYKLLRTNSPIVINKELQKLPKEKENKKSDLHNITHKKIKSETIIDNQLWDEAKWQAFGFLSTQSIPFGIFLSFENGNAGKKIFENWIKSYGRVDKNETIALTIIRGVDKNNPNWYKILISKNVDKKHFDDGNLVSMSSRFHVMTPNDGNNLTNIIKGYEYFKKFVLIPTQVDSNFKITPFTELGILKTQLKIIEAWQIGMDDIERMVITKEDDPIIPKDVNNAPILEVLKTIL